jgi:hypothetical protein
MSNSRLWPNCFRADCWLLVPSPSRVGRGWRCAVLSRAARMSVMSISTKNRERLFAHEKWYYLYLHRSLLRRVTGLMRALQHCLCWVDDFPVVVAARRRNSSLLIRIEPDQCKASLQHLQQREDEHCCQCLLNAIVDCSSVGTPSMFW